VIAELLGVPPADRERIKQWSDDFMFLLSSDPSSIPHAHYERAAQGSQNLTDYFRVIVAERRASPRADLLTALEQAEEQGDKLSEDELFGTANILMVAGHETTTNLIGNGLLALLRHPDQLQRLRDDPALLPQAIEEMLRYDGSVQFVTRIARDDVSMRGKTTRAGQFVHLVLGAANRDPEHFPDPDRFDVTRATDKQLTFGNGIHVCLGIALARLEGRVAFRTLLRRFPPCVSTPRPWNTGLTNLRGLKALPWRSGEVNEPQAAAWTITRHGV
jgi:cytochrome P450